MPHGGPGAISRYKLGRLLGKGAFGEVREGWDTEAKRKVAVKLVRKGDVSDIADAERVSREFFILTSLEHAHVTRLYEVISDEEFVYICMEFAGGGTLSGIMSGGLLPLPKARQLFYEIACAVAYCHGRDVAHRDLKPDNILLSEEGEAKVADFGLSQLEASRAGSPVGTPLYAAPEVLFPARYAGTEAGAASSGSTADVWSLGVILYEMLVGKLPFEGNTVAQLEAAMLGPPGGPPPKPLAIPSTVPSPAVLLLRSMLNVDPSARPSAMDVAENMWVSQRSSIAQLFSQSSDGDLGSTTGSGGDPEGGAKNAAGAAGATTAPEDGGDALMLETEPANFVQSKHTSGRGAGAPTGGNGGSSSGSGAGGVVVVAPMGVRQQGSAAALAIAGAATPPARGAASAPRSPVGAGPSMAVPTVAATAPPTLVALPGALLTAASTSDTTAGSSSPSVASPGEAANLNGSSDEGVLRGTIERRGPRGSHRMRVAALHPVDVEAEVGDASQPGTVAIGPLTTGARASGGSVHRLSEARASLGSAEEDVVLTGRSRARSRSDAGGSAAAALAAARHAANGEAVAASGAGGGVSGTVVPAKPRKSSSLQHGVGEVGSVALAAPARKSAASHDGASGGGGVGRPASRSRSTTDTVQTEVTVLKRSGSKSDAVGAIAVGGSGDEHFLPPI